MSTHRSSVTIAAAASECSLLSPTEGGMLGAAEAATPGNRSKDPAYIEKWGDFFLLSDFVLEFLEEFCSIIIGLMVFGTVKSLRNSDGLRGALRGASGVPLWMQPLKSHQK